MRNHRPSSRPPSPTLAAPVAVQCIDVRVPMPAALAAAVSVQARHSGLTRPALVRAALAALVARPSLVATDGATVREVELARRLNDRLDPLATNRELALHALLDAVRVERSHVAELARRGGRPTVDPAEVASWKALDAATIEAGLKVSRCVAACERVGL